MSEISILNGYKIKDKKAIRFYNTVDDMKNDSTLKEGMSVITKGYYSVNDGGASMYHITSIESNTEYQEEISNNLYATLVINDYVTPEMFGAKGNNTDNDSLAFQNAINYSDNVICDSEKTYLINGNLTIDNRKNLSIKGSKVNYTAEGNFITLSNTCFNIDISNFDIKGITEGAELPQCFIGNLSSNTNSFENINIHNNKIDTFTLGITVNANLSGHLRNIIIENNKISNILVRGAGTGYGIHIADGQDEDVKGIIRNNEISACASHCIYVARGSSYVIENNYIHNNGEAISSLAPAINLSRSRNITFRNNLIENINNGGLFFSSELNPTEDYSLESYPCENILIDNNVFRGSTNQYIMLIGYGEASIGFSKDITVSNNKFEETSNIGVFGVENLKIINNKFDTIANISPILVFSGTNETSDLYTHNLYIANNNFKVVQGQQRPIRLNNTIIGKDAKIVIENNIVNTGKIMQTQSNCSNGLISLINQPFDNDFYFETGITFNPVYINGVAQ